MSSLAGTGAEADADAGTEIRQCWICFSEESVQKAAEPDAGAAFTTDRDGIAAANKEGDAWIHPCRCRGTTRWVHQGCLLAWLDARAEMSPLHMLAPRVACPQCHEEYRLTETHVLPKWILRVLVQAALLKDRLLLYASIGGFVTGVYIVSFAYGLGNVAVVLGRDELVRMLELLDAPFTPHAAFMVAKTAIALPLLPLYVLSLRYTSLSWLYPLIPALVYSGPHSLRWSWPLSRSTSASILPFATILYDFFVKKNLLPLVRSRLLPGEPYHPDPNPEDDNLSSPLANFDVPPATPAPEDLDEDHTLRVSVIGAAATLLLPGLSAGVGYVLFGRTAMDPFHRTLLGGCLIFLTRDLFATFSWYQRRYSRRFRRILNYTPPPPATPLE